tara:strand:- start:335 stop:532 length:198 start_codon:yes stop_codon:yes gene_type:complete
MIKYFLVIIFLTVYSCGYPDIDSVPDFNNLVITDNEAIDLCKLSSKNDIDFNNCVSLYNESLKNK